VLGEVLDDLLDSACYVALVRPNVDLGAFRCFVRGGDAGEVLDLAGAGLLVEALGIALLDNAKGRIDKDLDESEVRLLVELACDLAIGNVGRDERGHGDARSIGEQLRHLPDASDVLDPRLLVEAEILVEPEADVVPVKAVRELVTVEEVLLEGTRNSRLGYSKHPEDDVMSSSPASSLAMFLISPFRSRSAQSARW